MGLGSEIRDLGKTYYGSRIQGSKRHQIPDPQHCWKLTVFVSFVLFPIRVADPDPYPDPNWIRIQSGQWIRIRNPDPDPTNH